MIEYVFISVLGPRTDVERFRIEAGLTEPIVDRPGGSTMDFEIDAETPKYAKAEELIKRYQLDPFRRRRVESTPEELATADLFSNVGCGWIEDDEDTLSAISVTGEDACPHCGKGIREHADLLRGAMRSLRKYHLVRKPPPWILGSTQLVGLIQKRAWSGVEVRPIIERTTGQKSEEFCELWVTSVLPSMHASGGLERSPVPDFCEKCRKLGYQLKGRQLVYARSVLPKAADFNLSSEWWARHYVSGPDLICSRSVVHELLKLEPSQKWIPVRLVD